MPLASYFGSPWRPKLSITISHLRICSQGRGVSHWMFPDTWVIAGGEVCTPVSEGQRAVQARMLPRPCLSPSQEKEGGGERERVLLALWGYQTSG